MASRIMDLKILINSEIKTKKDTASYLPSAKSLIEYYVNSFFKYHYHMKEVCIPDSPDHNFHSFAYYTYIRLPYNIRSIYSIWEHGYYLESLILSRHIIESFIQLRYFYKYKDKIEPHSLANKSRNRVQFKTMFDEFAPGFYEFIYGKFYSRLAHGHFFSLIFRANFTHEKGELIYGCQYNNLHSMLVINQLTTFCYAYLNYLELFFPLFSVSSGSSVYKDYLDNLSRLRTQISKPKETEEFQKDFEKMILPLIEK